MDGLVEYSCRCGKARVKSYYRPPGCRGCTYCGTLLSETRTLLSAMLEHDYAEDELVYTEKGATVFIKCCTRCGIYGSITPTFIFN